jgi:cation transport ATPase
MKDDTMLLELTKPIALMLCMLSLCAVFYTAFMAPAINLEQRTWDSLVLISLAAGICLTSGLIFRGSEQDGNARLTATLPVQMFFWATCWMLVLFVVSWYLETHCIFYKDVRRF